MKTAAKLIPGAALALALAAVAKLLEGLEEQAGLHFIGASVIALFLGMLVNAVRKPTAATAPGIHFQAETPVAWMWVKGFSSDSSRRKSTIWRFISRAPRLPQEETTSGFPS